MNYKATTIEDKHKSFINAMFNNTIKIKLILVCSKKLLQMLMLQQKI